MCANPSTQAALMVASQVWASRRQGQVGARQATNYGEAASVDFQALADRERQIVRRAQDQRGVRALQAQRDIGRINAVLADSNLVGNSAARLRREVLVDAATDDQRLVQEATDQRVQVGRERDATSGRLRSALNSIQRPSTVEAGLTGAGLGVRLWDDLDKKRRATEFERDRAM